MLGRDREILLTLDGVEQCQDAIQAFDRPALYL